MLWSIWKSRNNKVFRDMGFTVNKVLVRARRMSKERRIRNEFTLGEEGGKERKSIHKSYLVRWEPPPNNYIKINFDGSIRGKTAATGFVI